MDLPAAAEFTLHILAAVAQKETATISRRNRDALTAKKAREFVLGTPANLTSDARARGLRARRANALANVHNQQAAQLPRLLQDTGVSLRAIADRFNQSGYCTRPGKAFHPHGHAAAARRKKISTLSEKVPQIQARKRRVLTI